MFQVTISTPAVSNPRHRRSRSVSDDRWLEHRPQAPVPLNTVLQPVLKKRKSVTKLTDVKDVTNSKTSKYCLMTQNQDSEGDLETNIYKVSDVCLTQLKTISNLCSLNINPSRMFDRYIHIIVPHGNKADISAYYFRIHVCHVYIRQNY